jgi:tripartite-type tricarboxylate transporter receptor subunit TctC
MSQEMNKVARDPELRPLLLKTALAPNPGTPEELEALLRSDYERYGALVRRLNLRTE